MKRKALLVVILFLIGIPLAFPMASKKPKYMAPPENPRFEGLVHAPEFPQHLDWLNTNHKPSLKNLKGKIVLLDFWTFCCINCMHVIPDLKKLEAKYPNELVVIGVHSAKFQNERELDSIHQAIRRYEIKHPVINDRDLEVWSEYGINSWPTLVLINPNGQIIEQQSGEDVFDSFDRLIAQTIEYFDKKGQLNHEPFKNDIEDLNWPGRVLSFPGKIRADHATNSLYISDSNHNRILITDTEGRVRDKIGSGEAGKADGKFETAQLFHPQGIFGQGDLLYIADTESHLIRQVNLKTREVKTILGTGEKAREIQLHGKGTEAALNSPWDLLVLKEKLYIVMAGSHQIYEADLKTLELKLYAGSGQEGRRDGSLLNAALAQPSGITTNGSQLFIADSEVSSVRAVDLGPSGKVSTIIGKDLFEFGDVDGDQEKARLQHALGIEFDENSQQLYVADTYNSKIKIIDPFKKTSRTLAGTGEHGYKDGEFKKALFFEPGGLTLFGERVYVADTNNHQIRVIDLKTQQVSTLAIWGLGHSTPGKSFFKGRAIESKPVQLKEGAGSVTLIIHIPTGYHLNKEAPFHIEMKSGANLITFEAGSEVLEKGSFGIPLEIPVTSKAGKEDLFFETVVYYCKNDSKVCLLDPMRIHVPVEVNNYGPSNIQIEVDVLAKP